MEALTSEPIYLTVEEAAGILRVDRKTVLKAVNERVIPALRLGRLIRIHRDAIVLFQSPRGRRP